MALGWKKQYFRYKDFFLNIVLLYKKREVKIFLEMLLSLITITVLSVFALKPTLETIAQLLKSIQAKEVTLNQLNEKISALTTAQNVYEQETANISAIKFAVPDQPGVEILDRQIEMLAVQNSVKVLNFIVEDVNLVGKPVIQPDTEGLSPFPEGSAAIPLSITVTGNYSALFAFQKGLENLRRPIKIDSAKIFSVATETGSNQNLSISGRVPYLLNK